MDPISIITLAGSATTATYQVSKAIYEFINAVKEVDVTVTALSSEMASLRRSLDAIGTVLANPLIKSDKARAPENTPIWAATAGALEDCRTSLSAVDKKIAPHQREKARRTLFKRAVTAMKLNLSKEEIANLRSQIQTHTHSLQLALQMINLLVSGIGPANAVEDIGQEISNLSTTLEELDVGQAGEYSKSLARIHETARDMLNKAPEFVSTGLLEIADEDVRDKSIQALRSVVSDYNRSIYQNQGLDLNSSGNNALADDNDEDWDSDSDEEIEVGLTKDLFAKANDRFQQGSYQEAEAYYRDGLRHLANVARVGDSLDPETTRLKLAICCFNLKKFEEAELMLLILGKGDDQITSRVLEVYHYLAQIYLCLYNFESALDYASLAVKGRRRLLGKSHPQYFSSVKLQSLVYESNGDFFTAEAYAKKLPTSWDDSGDIELAFARLGGYSSSEHLRLSLKEKDEALKILANSEVPGIRGRAPVVGSDSLNMHKALGWACETGNPLFAKWLLARGAAPEGEVQNGTPLLLAASTGNEEITTLLLRSGARTELTDSSGRTPLYWAALWGYQSTVATLIKNGANVDAAESDGQTPLMGAAYKGHVGVLKLLVAAGANVNVLTHESSKNALLRALDNSQFECAEYLISEGSEIDRHDWNGENALQKVADRRVPSTVARLLAAGADPNASARDGERPLHISLRCLDEATVKLLLENGADVNAGRASHSTALYEAANRGYADIMRMLIKHGADRNATRLGDLLPGAVLKHNGVGRMIDVLKDYPDFKDCRDEGKECQKCSRWDDEISIVK